MIGRSKILDYENKWFDEIDPITFYEKHFEKTFLSKLSEVYPDYIGVPFGPTIRYGDETSRPDLAMIKNDYSEWFVIEVEMGRHDWDGHVDKQVRVFTNGHYEKKHIAKKILEKNGDFDKAELEKMIDENQPKVMVVVNELSDEWREKIKTYKGYLSLFQIYKGVDGFEIYRIEGDTPFVYRSKSHCSFLKGSSNILEVYTPTFITESHNTEMVITFNGKFTKWKRLIDGGKTRLIFEGRTHYLQLEKKYVLYLSDSDEYFLETI